MSARKKPRPRHRPAPPPLRSIDDYADRAKRSGELYDAAILQFLREHLWQLLESDEVDQAAKLLSAIVAARRQHLAETKAKPGSPENDAKARDDILEKMLDPELRSPMEKTL